MKSQMSLCKCTGSSEFLLLTTQSSGIDEGLGQNLCLLSHLIAANTCKGEYSAILSTFIKLPFVIKTFVLSVFEWPLKTGFTVPKSHELAQWIKTTEVNMSRKCDSHS